VDEIGEALSGRCIYGANSGDVIQLHPGAMKRFALHLHADVKFCVL
jgi:hypothetical protein